MTMTDITTLVGLAVLLGMATAWIQLERRAAKRLRAELAWLRLVAEADARTRRELEAEIARYREREAVLERRGKYQETDPWRRSQVVKEDE
jgi:hypothetical protein